jgi:bifunctional UDP-N-acetylglucosamine pyrophosphorylase/glucosamine-1-phosphate N-acetyltransferase
MVSEQPKVLHRLAGAPLAAHVLRAVALLSPARTVMVVGHAAGEVRATLGDTYGPDGSLPLEYVLQPEQLGTGHAVMMAEPLLRNHRGPILIMYGDSPLLRTETLTSLISRHRQAGTYLTMLTCIAADPTGYGRVMRDQNGSLMGVVEEKAATLVQRAISEVNSGVYVFDSDWLWSHLSQVRMNAQGEYYLTDLVGIAIEEERLRRPIRPDLTRRAQYGVMTFTLEGLDEAMGINSRAQLADAERAVQTRLRQKWMNAGVTMLLPDTVYLGMDVEIGPDTVLYPGVILEGSTSVGPGCVIGPNTHVVNSVIGDHCRVVASMLEGSTLDSGVTIGPYGHIRAGSHLKEGVHLGNFGEVKASTLEPGVMMGHFSYVGDATVGEGSNIGAGTVTVNYDGERKHHTEIGRHAFIGSGTMLRAPVEVGENASTGAGSVVLHDVPPNAIVAGVPARVLRYKDAPQEPAAGAQDESEQGEAQG